MAETVKDHGESQWLEEMFVIRIAVSMKMVRVDKAITGHAWKRGDQRDISPSDIIQGLGHPGAKIIAGEPPGARLNGQGAPYPTPTRKIATWDNEGRPICLVVALLPNGFVKVVTVYPGKHDERPNPEHSRH